MHADMQSISGCGRPQASVPCEDSDPVTQIRGRLVAGLPAHADRPRVRGDVDDDIGGGRRRRRGLREEVALAD